MITGFTKRRRKKGISSGLPVFLFLFLIVVLGMTSLAWHRYRRNTRAVKRSDAYDFLIADAARRHRLPPLLVTAVVWKESRFQPDVRGRHGEVGLMQITEGAILEWQRANGWALPTRGQCLNPRLNLEIGTWYLARAVDYWRTYRDWDILSLAEYNAGRSRAIRWAPADKEDHVPLSAISFPSTREYIRQVRSKWRQLEKEQRSREQRTTFGATDIVAG